MEDGEDGEGLYRIDGLYGGVLMMRFARVASFLAIALSAATAAAEAQTQATATGAPMFSAAFEGGASFGHKSSGTLSGEFGVRLTGPLSAFHAFFEAGRIMNAGTGDLDERAQKIANAVGATVSASYKINFFDAGIRYAVPTASMPWKMPWKLEPPYLMFGFGVAQVKAKTELAVDGIIVPADSLGVQFGTDLNGTVSKPYMVIGGGTTYPFAKRYFADINYRYGRVFARTGITENDKGINTQRLQAGVGIKF